MDEILKRDLVGGLQNGLAVIEAFDESRPRLSLSEVASITGLTRAAARRYLLTLRNLGYAEHDGKFFSLTPKILRLGYAYLASSGLPWRLQPFLDRISKEVRETSSAAVLDDLEIVYVGRSARSRTIMLIGLSVGSRLPAYCTSLGRALMAHQPAPWLDAYFSRVKPKRLTPKSKTTERDLRRELEKVRELGYSLVDEELELGLCSLAVPVFDAQGKAVCAINVTAQTGRTSPEDLLRIALSHLERAREDLRRLV
jgi:IclR family pca regulon transcriptional regulator